MVGANESSSSLILFKLTNAYFLNCVGEWSPIVKIASIDEERRRGEAKSGMVYVRLRARPVLSVRLGVT